MSQVHIHEMPHLIKESARSAKLIVVAERVEGQEIYRKVVFPKSTHHSKAQTTTHVEYKKPYIIKDILYSDAKIKEMRGDKIFLYQRPAYRLDDIKDYHEQGISKSPIILEKTAVYPPQSNTVILFLDTFDDIYEVVDTAPEEGIEGLEKVKRLIRGRTNLTLWYYEDRSAFHGNGMAIVIGEDGEVFYHHIDFFKESFRKERICENSIDPKGFMRVKSLVAKTKWSKLEFKGTLIPDETRPSLYIGLKDKRSWTIEPALKTKESGALQEIITLVKEMCSQTKEHKKDMKEIDFKLWPETIRDIYQ